MNTLKKRFRNFVQQTVKSRTYIKIQFFTDIREFITTTSVAKSLNMRDGREYLTLATGEEIPLNLIVRIDEEVAPQYKDIMDFTCDC